MRRVIFMYSENMNSISNAFSKLETNAINLSKAGFDETVQIEKEMVGMIENKNTVALNVKAIQFQDESIGTLLDMLG